MPNHINYSARKTCTSFMWPGSLLPPILGRSLTICPQKHFFRTNGKEGSEGANFTFLYTV